MDTKIMNRNEKEVLNWDELSEALHSKPNMSKQEKNKLVDKWFAYCGKVVKDNEVDTAVFVEYVWRSGREDSTRVIKGKKAYQEYLSMLETIQKWENYYYGTGNGYSDDENGIYHHYFSFREDGDFRWGEAIYFKRK